MEHAGKVAVITGGGRGFGLGVADAFAAAGAAVAIIDRDGPAAEAAIARIVSAGGRGVAIVSDVSDEQAIDAAMIRIEESLGRLDYLLNNAGLLAMRYSEGFSTIDRAVVRDVLEVNVIGVINCAVAARPGIARSGGGAVVNMASLAAYTLPGPYGLSKLAVRGLTVALAREFAPDGIRVNGVAPGLMATESVMADLPADMVRHFIEDQQLIKRQGQPRDIVDAVMFLCSERSSFITGETLRVSGGQSVEV